jgi:AraC-like DNA-binding protein
MYSQRPTTINLLEKSIEAIWHSKVTQGDTSLIVPDGASDIIIKSSQNRIQTVYCGAMTKAASIEADEDINYWAIRFNAGHASLFFDFDMSESLDSLIEIENAFESKDQISEYMTDPEKNSKLIEAEISRFLRKRMATIGYEKKIKQLQYFSDVSFGSISEKARQLGVTRRHFGRIFKNYFGYSPREYSRIKQFNNLTSKARLNEFESLADLAVQSGYYDQSDMTKAVKELCNLTPSGLMSQLYNP